MSDAYMSRPALIDLAKKREEALKARAIAALGEMQLKLNGLTQLLGCIIEQTGELSYDLATEIGEMDPRRVVIIEQEGAWTVRLKDDGAEPYVHAVDMDNLPEGMLENPPENDECQTPPDAAS